ncbi:hypothetical protein C8J57DRAFT_1246992 [Mycena rebaudengoi]|nr:hypothetical protein C8J57DRAFT_1246992 [Mycena rebaudengoi]
MFIKVLFALGVTLMELVHAAPEQHHGDRRDNLYSSMEQDRFVYLYSPWKIDAYGQVPQRPVFPLTLMSATTKDTSPFQNKICSGVGSGMAKFFNISKGGQQGMFTIGNADSSILWTVLDQGRGEVILDPDRHRPSAENSQVNLTAPDTDNPQSHLWTFELIDDYSMPQSLM